MIVLELSNKLGFNSYFSFLKDNIFKKLKYGIKVIALSLILLMTININLISQEWFKIDSPKLFNDGSGYSTYDQSISVKTDANGNIYHTGYFEGIIVFGTDTLVSEGSRDLFVSKLDNQGNYLWAVSAGGKQSDYGKDVSVNSVGEVFVTGYFFGSAKFGSIEISSFSNADAFIAKLDSTGNWIWAKNIAGDGFDRGNSIVAVNDDCYITGYFDSNVQIGVSALASIGSKDIFVAKINNNGNWVWAKSAGGTSSDDAYNIGLDINKNVIITGYFSSTASFGSINLISAGSRDPFIAKLDSSGNWIWAKRVGSSNSDEITASYVDNNDIYVGGFYSKSFSVDTFNLATPTNRDIWLAKLDSSGNWIWVKTLNGVDNESIYSISCDNDFVYLSGGFEKDLNCELIEINSIAGRNGFYSKLDKNANLHYLKAINGNQNIDAYSIAVFNKNPVIIGTFFDNIILAGDTINSMGDSDIFIINLDSNGTTKNYKINYGVKGIIKLLSSEIDKNDNIILSGYFYGNAEFGKDTLSSNGKKDAFIAKYSLINGFLWAKSFGSIADDELKAIAIDSSNQYYFGGNFSNDININNLMFPNLGFKDIFLVKTDSNGAVIFTKHYGGIQDDDCNSIAIYQNNLAFTGTFGDEIKFGTTTLNSGTYDDIFVASLTQNGNNNWAVKAGGTHYDVGIKIISANNNLFVAGSFEETATFGNKILIAAGGDDMFISKLSTSGNWLWAKSIGSDYFIESANSICSDSKGNIYVAGNYKAIMEIDSQYVLHNGDNDIFVGKISDAGNWIWMKGIGGPSSDLPTSLSMKNDALYLTANYKEIINLGNKIYSNDGNSSSIIVVLDTNGNINNSHSEKSSYNSQPINLLISKNNNLCLTGNFQYNITFDNESKFEKWKSNENIYLANYGIEPISNRWNVIANTGRSSEIILPKSINPKISNENIQVGDAVGIFFTRNSNHYCAGYGIWNDEDLVITVWGDNLSTSVKDGMANNESYIVKSWKGSTGQELITDVRYLSGPSRYSDNAESIISKFPFYHDTLKINLSTGWNLISTNTKPYNLKLDTIFKNYKDDILIVKNSKGQSYIPSYNINTIGNWNIHQGYQVYALKNTTIKIIGEYINPEDEQIVFQSGWSYLAYLRRNSMNIEDALSSISSKGKLLIAKSASGQTFIPSYNINTIGNMVPGKGYQTYFLSTDTLIYPENSIAKSISKKYDDFEPQFLNKLEMNNPNNSTLIIESSPNYNDYEIGVFNTKNNLIGSGRIIDGLSIITIYGNEDIANIDYFINENDKFIIRLYNKKGNFVQEINEDYLYSISNTKSNLYINNQVFKLKMDDSLISNIKIFPNPAVDYLNILSADNNIDFEIYDLNNRKLMEGNTKKVNIEKLSSGTYFIKIKSDNSNFLFKFVKMN